LSEDHYPQGNTRIGTAEVVQMVKDSGVDAVIVGNAA
jgi:predicted Fe-Mo cluster-binding NifX family protein